MAERKSTSQPPATGKSVPETPVEPDDSGPAKPIEHGGPRGPEPTRYGDWERNGKCVDF